MPTIRRLNAFLSLSAVVVAGLLLTGCGNGVGVSPATANAAGAPAPSSSAPTPAPSPAPTPPAPAPSPTTGTATLSWTAPTENTNGTPLTNLAGYHIYYGTSAGAWTSTITILDPTETSYVVDGLAGGTYYFAIVAFNSEGDDGPQSNVGSKKI